MLVVRVEVWPGGSPLGVKEVGTLYAGNISDLANTSDYSVSGVEYGAKHLDISASSADFTIEGHDRNQSVFSLVEKLCAGYLANKHDK